MLCLGCEKEKKVIVCWGDSLTAPWNRGVKGSLHSVVQGNDYPYYMQKMLGNDYEVVNAGVSGENTLTIMGRQGAFPMLLAHDVTIFRSNKAKFKTIIGNNDIPIFLSAYNGMPVTPFIQCDWREGSSAFVNPCTIDGKEFTISAEATYWPEAGVHKVECNYYIEPHDYIDDTDTLRAGSIVETQAMKKLRGKYAYVFLMGGNGGFSDTAELIQQYRAMINYSQSKRYIVMSFHMPLGAINSMQRLTEMEDSLCQHFGRHYVNLRKYMVEHGLREAGLTPTQEDRDSMAHGRIPPQLLRDGKHFTGAGNQVMATMVYRKLQQLGY